MCYHGGMDAKFQFEWYPDLKVLMATFAGAVVNIETNVMTAPTEQETKEFALNTFLGLSERGAFSETPIVRLVGCAFPDFSDAFARYYEKGSGYRNNSYDVGTVEHEVVGPEYGDLVWHVWAKPADTIADMILGGALDALGIRHDYTDGEYRWVLPSSGFPFSTYEPWEDPYD